MSSNGTGKSAYKRIVLKLSGEALAGKQGYGIDPDSAAVIAHRIKQIHDTGIQIAVVIGATTWV
jgi:uridylate kinase